MLAIAFCGLLPRFCVAAAFCLVSKPGTVSLCCLLPVSIGAAGFFAALQFQCGNLLALGSVSERPAT